MIFRHKKWLDNPWNVQIAEDKLFQLKCAMQIGFNIPETLATSDPIRIKNFYEKHNGNVVVKALSASPIVDHVLYTNKLTNKDIAQIDSVKMSPSIFQVYVSKKYELRITVVGNKIFPVKIYSQGDEATSLDWRRKPKLNDFDVKMEQTTLPIKIERYIHCYMKLINLRYGCIDMIVTENDEYVFLEINPNGQWYFVQLHTEAQIAKAISELLTN